MALNGKFLPEQMHKKGKDVRVFMPRFGTINTRSHQLHEIIRLSGKHIQIGEHYHTLMVRVASLPVSRLQVYFIDNDEFFKRKQIVTDENGVLLSDNDERMMFFGYGVLETVMRINWVPDIIHCSGWFTSLIPLFLRQSKMETDFFSKTKVIYYLYNDAFEGQLGNGLYSKLITNGSPEENIQHLKEPSYINIIKEAIDNSDAVIESGPGVNATLLEYVKEKHLPLLEYKDPKEAVDDYIQFYKSVMEH